MLDITRPDKTTDAVTRAPRVKFSYDFLGTLFASGDAVIIVASSIAGGAAYQVALGASMGDLETYAAIGIVTGLAYEFIAWNAGLYRVQTLLQARRDYGQILAAWLGAVLLLSLLLFLLKLGQQVSRGSIVCFIALGLVALVILRKYAKRHLRDALASGAVQGRPAILIGTRSELLPLSDMQLLLTFGLRGVDRVVLPDHKAGTLVMSRIHIAAMDTALECSRSCSAEEIIVALPWGNSVYLNFVRERLRLSPLPVRLLPDQHIRSIWEGTTSVGAPTIEIQRAPLGRVERAVKRVFDILIAAFGLIVHSPLLLAVAVLIKLDSAGPVIFRQRRKGFNGQDFFIYKFRTMRVMEDGPQIAQATRRDPRVTRVGRMLRRSSIDELPQLLNVLKGDMSLVGPRPHAVAHDDQYGALIGEYALRRHVKPGISGWAQVNGYRGETRSVEQMKARIELDLWYINNWSLTLDIQIVAKTLVELIRHRNAY
jgi:Undecaprenyl-phosphate glucose phosphotransferase